MGSCYAVKYEARLEDGSLVTKSEEVEFIVKDGIKCRFFKYDSPASKNTCAYDTISV